MTAECDALVLGAAGLVGSHLRAAFSGRHVATYHGDPAPDAVALDVTDAAAVRALVAQVRPKTVLLAAAEAHVERCEREPKATRRVNVEGARTVAEACRAIGAMLVVFSSEYIFEGSAGPYAEDDPVDPINEYGRQKVALEEIARSVPTHLICRTSGVFGWERSRKNFVCQLVDSLRRGESFVVPSDQVITPTYAPDLADAARDLVDTGQRGTFHVCGPAVVNRLDFALLAARAFGLPESLIRGRPTASLSLLAPRPHACGLSARRLRQTLGRSLRPPTEALTAMRASEGA